MDIRISVILEVDTKTDDLFFSFLPVVHPSIDLSLLFHVFKDTWIKQQQLVGFTCRPRTFYNRVHAPILPTDGCIVTCMSTCLCRVSFFLRVSMVYTRHAAIRAHLLLTRPSRLLRAPVLRKMSRM